MMVMPIAHMLDQLRKLVEWSIAELAGMRQDLPVGSLDGDIFKEEPVEGVTLALSLCHFAERLETMDVVLFVVVEPKPS